MTYRYGFTLIELLVVITIIAMLMGILFPVFASTRRRSYQTTCLSNERQIGMAMLLYANNYDDTFFSSKTSNEGWAHDAIYPLVKNTGVFRCPSDPTEDEVGNLKRGKDADATAYVNSYAINSNLVGSTLADLIAPTHSVLLFEVRNCTETFTTSARYNVGSSDGNGGHSLSCSPDCLPLDKTQPGMPLYATGRIGGRMINGTADQGTPRHGDGANYVAADGHAVWLRPQVVSGGDNQPSGGSHCGQDDTTSGCSPKPSAAGTESLAYSLTFSIR